ncbi:hypothetical protein [Streptomyces sp. NBC_00140]|uniref:hypothetical protein n=1 Tax=Streptomyces sp. NBC_00140 TaxID=2975664 RepID=UPI0022575212|nr:hypothetical protein [Streptomyces sp. NBC_00140]MCX5328151.1 hypothetical protein [Streptomyces sp. NBC_00140]
MADKLTDLQAQIVTQNKAAVEALLGKPLKIGYWKTPAPPQGADTAAIASFRATTLDEIWIYTSGRVHFSLDDTAVKVDDTTSRDLPPPENIV